MAGLDNENTKILKRHRHGRGSNSKSGNSNNNQQPRIKEAKEG